MIDMKPNAPGVTGEVPRQARARPAAREPAAGVSDFERLLRQQRTQQQSRQAQQALSARPLPGPAPGALTFSKHAQQRLEKRSIQLRPEQSQRLQSAVVSAAQKGAQNSLVLMDGMAFVVNVADRKVVTALNAGGGAIGQSAVFTNIDSAVVA